MMTGDGSAGEGDVALAAESLGDAIALQSSSTAKRNRAWAALYQQHFHEIYRLVARCGIGGADSEDITQQVFVIAHRRVADLDPTKSVGGWLRGITVRLVSEHFRWRRVRRAKAWVLRLTMEEVTPRPSTPEQRSEAHEAQEQIARVLSRMSKKLREALELTDIAGCTPQETADILGIPVNTVRSRQQLAREEFRRLWGRSRPRGSGRSHGR